MPTRREFVAAGAGLAGLAALPALAQGPGAQGPRGFVRREGTRFTLDGAPYRYVGANMWYAAYLGAAAPLGDPDRLRRELDALAALGVTNVRILASSELSPLKNSLRPTFRDRTPRYNAALLDGLDLAMAEIARRGMKAVLYLTNFWEWSGGMMTYLSWVNGGRYIDMNDLAHPWPQFADMASQFYRRPRAVAMYLDYVRAVVGRTNRVTGRAYADDPAIMAWQLSNEPRPGGGEAVAKANMPAFLKWVGDTAWTIRVIDRNHLVSTGSEGLKGCVEDAGCVLAEHRVPGIDYLTTHIWPLNWSWVDAKDLPGTWEAGSARSKAYLDSHVALATQLGRPLVVEEFGFPRDGGRYDPAATTAWRDRFYRLIHDAVIASAETGGPIAGSNFWAWGGSGVSGTADWRYAPGPRHYLGDPPHEPQGWYSVMAGDTSTTTAIRDHAAALARVRA